MGQIASDFYNKFGRMDAMEASFGVRELLMMASMEVREEYAGWMDGDSDEDYMPGDMLISLLKDPVFFSELLKMRDAGEYVVLSGITIGITSEHIDKMGITQEDAAENIVDFLENEESISLSIRSAMPGGQTRVSGICVFANGWFGVETESAADTVWMDEEDMNGDRAGGGAPRPEDLYEPSTSYLFSAEGDLIATPDLRYDIDAWMDFVDLFSAIHEEAAAVEDNRSGGDDSGYGQEYIVYSEEVQEAVRNGKPVVVIESAATFAGMIYPGISEFAFRMSSTVREYGAAPAFVAIIGGQIHIGLTDDEIRYLETRRGSIFKASARDIPVLLAMRADAVMTIAAAVRVASMVGLYVACGSGIGGAQIGAEKTMDISTDLESLARNTVMVVCSGTKPILDLYLTMEYLETAGVPVIGYKTDRMPEYMVRGSGFRLTYRMETPHDLAEVMKIKAKMGISGGVLVVNPVPKEYELDPVKTKLAVDAALKDVSKNNVRGKAITGYMMGRIKEYLGGESVESQKAFLINNAKLAARIAKEIQK